MTKSMGLSRRAFVRMMGFAPVVARSAWARSEWVRRMPAGSRVAYAAAMPGARAGTPARPGAPAQAGIDERHEIRVYGIAGERWSLKQVVASAAPVSLTVHPNRRFLYAVNEVDRHEGLPAGTVEAYAIDGDGKLTFVNRRGLSLSATLARHLALSPDGRSAIVSVHGGGAYNLLAIGEDGSLGQVAGIVKETGCGPRTEFQEAAHPQMAVFDTAGRRVLAVDMGADRLSVLSLEDGRLAVRERYELDPGSGPRQIAVHPTGRWIYLANGFDDAVCGYRYDAASGRVLGRVERVEIGSGATIALHPSGEFLYTAGNETGIRSWRVDAATGRLVPIRGQSEFSSEIAGSAEGKVAGSTRSRIGGSIPNSIRAMTFDHDGAGLLALGGAGDALEGVIRLPIDARSGRLGQGALVASVPGVRSVAIL